MGKENYEFYSSAENWKPLDLRTCKFIFIPLSGEKKKKQKFWAKFPNIAINLDQRGGFENYPRVRRGQTGERGQTGSKSVIQLAFVRRFTWETEKRDTVECRV